MTTPETPLPTVSISGTVTFKSAPLAGATVTLWLTNTSSIQSTTTTDANGKYSFTSLRTGGNVPDDYHLWAMKDGYGFHPSVGSGAKGTRADHTGEFVQPTLGIPMYLEVIEFVATANNSVTNANFSAYDGTNPLVSVAATGQTQSYAPGDDGALKKGIAWPRQRYADNQDGTVTDNVTGLIWLKNAGCFAPATWSTAVAEANSLAGGTCGLSDSSATGQWRLPNLVELESLIDPSASDPALTAGNPFTNVAKANYWTATSYFGGQEGSPTAWVIRMSDGRYINDYAQNQKSSAMNGVWAVKGSGTGTGKLQATGLYYAYQAGDDGTLQKGVPLVYPRFIDHGDGTMTDAMTGLVWLKLANCIEGDWATAVASVNKLASGQCGLTDGSAAGQWRMPNRREMQSLADRNQNNEAEYLDFTFLNPARTVFQAAVLNNFVPSSYYWTSTTNAADPTEAWTVFSCDYGVYDISKSESQYTLAVR
ncbi:MAG TPA: DUF1566 domain-containing protein [Terracidiphilus sp.]|jgi:hypothetical protein